MLIKYNVLSVSGAWRNGNAWVRLNNSLCYRQVHLVELKNKILPDVDYNYYVLLSKFLSITNIDDTMAILVEPTGCSERLN